MDWNEIARFTREAFRVAANEWIGRARIQGGTVKGPAAVLEMRMNQLLADSRVPRDIAAALAKVLSSAWSEWAAGFQMRLPKAYPTLAAVPARFAPPTPVADAPLLSQGSSLGESSLKAPQLTTRLSSALQIHSAKVSGGNPGAAMQNLANWVDGSFTAWRAGVRMTGLLGKGPVPTFAPPYVPIGPVVAGENTSAATLFAGPRFGKVVL
jgi:hypothetical protein